MYGGVNEARKPVSTRLRERRTAWPRVDLGPVDDKLARGMRPDACFKIDIFNSDNPRCFPSFHVIAVVMFMNSPEIDPRESKTTRQEVDFLVEG
ncbi:hypothetical protein K0M31_012965 [Melipona bicolor]|uniref:Uncharacterized protein n=1 Tax=Melipona bicolor TaxID=60889 RepID=A0AA40KGZ5_9HYME|nr:hypothetical protein K0M31_012965 [Melipona bicolor]